MFSYVTYMHVRNIHENELISPGTDLISLFTSGQIKLISKLAWFQKAQNKKVSNLGDFIFTSLGFCGIIKMGSDIYIKKFYHYPKTAQLQKAENGTISIIRL